MSNNTRHGLVSEILSVIGNALASASAVQQGRRPRAKDLRGLGIDPAEFRKIGRYYFSLRRQQVAQAPGRGRAPA